MNQKKRKTRKEKVKEHIAKLKKEGQIWEEEAFNPWSYLPGWVIAAIFFAALFFMSRTIVSAGTLCRVSFFISIVFVVYFYIYYWKVDLMDLDEVYVFFVAWAVLIGLISCTLVLVNAIPIKPHTEVVKVKIIEWENRKPKRGSKRPWAEIEYNGYRSALPFAKYSLSQVKDIDSLTIHVRKGLLGYGVVKSARLDVVIDN